ncbi:hypothetical protein BDA99DRAFT_543670 [Phascolomyces articulosus]|uniref:Uncharacterized protein n=1 Tax=Phascolomyces articulosus TaxID=60185 RepID=A0AAD5JLY2_9FUNG|nr:hypothetical protein BDA99DRAFT_543670 [Phascolomyces articulosus]
MINAWVPGDLIIMLTIIDLHGICFVITTTYCSSMLKTGPRNNKDIVVVKFSKGCINIYRPFQSFVKPLSSSPKLNSPFSKICILPVTFLAYYTYYLGELYTVGNDPVIDMMVSLDEIIR